MWILLIYSSILFFFFFPVCFHFSCPFSVILLLEIVYSICKIKAAFFLLSQKICIWEDPFSIIFHLRQRNSFCSVLYEICLFLRVWVEKFLMRSRSLSMSEPQTSPSSSVSAELKLYQAFIFSVPIFFAFILLFMFYLFYLRRRRADWSSLRMRTSPGPDSDLSISMVWLFILLIIIKNIVCFSKLIMFVSGGFWQAELGLKKEVREMLPIIIYKETFSIRDSQWVTLLFNSFCKKKKKKKKKDHNRFSNGK